MAFPLGRIILATAVAACLLQGCGSGGPPTPRVQGFARSADLVQSWAAKDAASYRQLLYVTDAQDGDVYMLALPEGRLVGKLTGFNQPLGDCVDKLGDVFVIDSGGGNVREFRHGARQPFNVLNDSGYYPLGCSIDPTTGNLAVTNFIGTTKGSQPGNVAIYTRARGKPKHYSDPDIFQYGYCSYDDRGNLYVDGITPPTDFPLVAELPKGKKTFGIISLNRGLGGNNVSPLLWDGVHLAIGSQDSAAIKRFQISGSKGTRVGSTRLKGSTGIGAFWMAGGKLFAPAYHGSLEDVGEYAYPAGGKPLKEYYAVINPSAVTLSVKKI